MLSKCNLLTLNLLYSLPKWYCGAIKVTLRKQFMVSLVFLNFFCHVFSKIPLSKTGMPVNMREHGCNTCNDQSQERSTIPAFPLFRVRCAWLCSWFAQAIQLRGITDEKSDWFGKHFICNALRKRLGKLKESILPSDSVFVMSLSLKGCHGASQLSPRSRKADTVSDTCCERLSERKHHNH